MRLALSALLILLSFNPIFAQEKGPERINVDLRDGVTFDQQVPFIPQNFSTKGDFKKIVRVYVNKVDRKVRFEPFRSGTAVLTMLDERGRKVYDFYLTVSKGQLSQVMREIRSLLADIDGIEVKIVNNKVIVDGEVLLVKDLDRIISVVQQYPKEATHIVRISALAQKKLAEFMERDINNPEIHVRAINEKFIIEGVATDEAEKQRAEIIAKTYAPDLVQKRGVATGEIKEAKVERVINLLTTKPAPEQEPGKIIKIIVHYVELQKDYSRGFRFQFTPEVSDSSRVEFSSGGREPGGILSQITATVSNLLPKLNWAKQHGHAKILQSSSMIVQDGKEGKIQSVTRIPYQVIGQGGLPSTKFEEAGIITAVTPKTLSAKSDSIDLSIDFALKSLLGITDKGPLVSDSKIKTFITVRSGHSAAIGGLVSNSSGADYNKLPKNVGENPLISLYASKSFRRNQSQFVVFITPVIVSSASTGSERVKQKFRIKD